MKQKFNIKSRKELEKILKEQKEDRFVLSFYKYTKVEHIKTTRDYLYDTFLNLGVLGRIYIASEGINAQISIPKKNYAKFQKVMLNKDPFKNIDFNITEDGAQTQSFVKLIVRIKDKIVADGIEDSTFNVKNTGDYINAKEINKAIEDDNTVVVDVRNAYESEIGRFKNAHTMKVDTFRQQIKKLCSDLSPYKNKKVVLYCTGGIRCEKASAWLRHNGFLNVKHIKQGIIGYIREVKEKGLPNKFIGKNFVFDDRRAESVTDDILSNCHICKNTKCDDYTDCKNQFCDTMFICCSSCAIRKKGFCSYRCLFFSKLPKNIKKMLVKNTYKKKDALSYKRKTLTQ